MTNIFVLSADAIASIWRGTAALAADRREYLADIVGQALHAGDLEAAYDICWLHPGDVPSHVYRTVLETIPTVEAWLIEADGSIELESEDLFSDEETLTEEFFLEATQVFPKLRAVA
jgi:hypothetical protein